MWTLEYDGVEKLFRDWKIEASCPFEFASQTADTLSITTPEDFDAPMQLAPDGKVIVRRDRNVVGSSFTGGKIFFQGYVAQPSRSQEGIKHNHAYTIIGPWGILEECQLQQSRNIFNGFSIPGDPTSDPTFRTVWDSELTLGEAQDESPLNSGQQIVQLLNWANECWNPTRRGASSGVDATQDLLQIGTIGVAVPVPKYPLRDLRVAEAIRQMLRWSQDAIAWFDYSTAPPTLHIKKCDTLPTVTMFADADGFANMRLKPRYDRQIPGVIIRYKATQQVDGATWTDVVTDKYPASVNEYEPRASVHTIELAGSNTITHEAKLECELCEPLSAAWWKKREPTLQDTAIRADSLTVHADSVKVLDKQGNPVSLATYPNRLVDGNVASWVRYNGNPVTVIHVTISAAVSYTKVNAGRKVETVPRKAVSVQAQLTNAVSGTYTSTEFTQGESVPVGLAQAIYDGFAQLQYEGKPTLLAKDVPDLAMGTTLTIETPNETFANILVQGISGDLATGTISPLLGPPGHIGLSDMIELLRVNRRRLVISLPSRRSTGKPQSSGSTVSLGEKTPKDNTTGDVMERSQMAVEHPATAPDTTISRIEQDAENKRLVVEVTNAAGERVPAHGSVELKLDDTLGTDGQKHAVKLQQVLVCIQGNRLAAIASISDLFDPDAPTP
jgi:hypothetical protein